MIEICNSDFSCTKLDTNSMRNTFHVKYSDIVPNFLNDLYIIIIEYQRVKVIICGINL